MPNQEIIDVLIAIDAETILQTYGTNNTPNAPVQVTATNLIYMITKQKDALSGNAGNELQIAAQTMDVIRWRETSLSMDAAYTGILYEFEATAGGDLISPPIPLVAEVQVPLPDPSNPTVPKTQKIESYFWNSTVLKPGDVTYHFKFIVCDRTGAIQGYFWWDPFIHITD
ncbi:inclusion body family protein [Psychroserpens sp.]